MSDAPAITRPPATAPDAGRTIRPRRSLPGGRAVVGAFLVVVAAVGTFGAYLSATAAPTTTYLVADRALELGHVIEEADLVGASARFRGVAMDLPDAIASRAYVSDTAVGQLVGRVVVAPIAPGDLVQRSQFLGVAEASDGVAMSFSLPVDRALAGRVGAGERLDLVATFSGAGALGNETRVVARDVTVMAVVAAGDGLQGGRVTLTVEVPDLATAQQVQHAVDTAQVALLRGGAADAPTPGIDPERRRIGDTAGGRGMSDRYVVAGLARARTEWFRRVGRWATEASIPVEFVRCVSVAELRARLAGGRPFSAVLVGSDSPGLDRDLLALAREVNAAPLVIADEPPRDWLRLGAAAVLPSDLDRQMLVDTLGSVATPIREVDLRRQDVVPAPPTGRQGRLVAVTGPGGTGASTVAMAAAQGLAEVEDRAVLLADLRRVAELAMLHDARVVVPGLQELVDAHRGIDPPVSTVVDTTFTVPARGYRLLLGLRRPRQWTTLRPRALEASLAGLRRAFDVTVADVDPDIEGEEETGSVDVEERHLASRLTLARADAVLVVGAPTTKGLFSLARLLGDLLTFGVPPQRIVTVCNRSPRSARQRAELTRSLAALLDGQLGGRELATPLHLPDRRVETAVRDGVALPAPLPGDLAAAVAPLLERPRAAEALAAVPVPVAPGSLGLVGAIDDEEDVA